MNTRMRAGSWLAREESTHTHLSNTHTHTHTQRHTNLYTGRALEVQSLTTLHPVVYPLDLYFNLSTRSLVDHLVFDHTFNYLVDHLEPIPSLTIRASQTEEVTGSESVGWEPVQIDPGPSSELFIHWLGPGG